MSKKKSLSQIFEEIRKVYKSIPETKGCMDHISIPKSEGGCEAWCCFLQQPQVLYAEFRNTWSYLVDEWEPEDVLDLIEESMRSYLSNVPTKGCVFWDKESNLCKQHNTRPYNCFLPGSYVLTLRGPVPIENILAGDLIYNMSGHLCQVQSTASRIYKGDILGVRQQGNHVPQWSTDDHLWLVARQKDKRKRSSVQWVEARNLLPKKGKEIGDYLVFPVFKPAIEAVSGGRQIRVQDFIDGVIIKEKGKERLICHTSGKIFSDRVYRSLPLFFDIDDEFLFMVGVYLAEGSSSVLSCGFHMNKSERHVLQRIEKLLFNYGVPSHYYGKNNNLSLRVDSALFGRFMGALCGKLAADKHINEVFYEKLNAKQRFMIFQGWSEGDGRKAGKTVAYSVVTISETLAIQMQQILLENNLYPRVQIEHKSNRGNNSYSVLVNRSSFPGWKPKKGQGSKIMYDEKYIYAPLADIETRSYLGPVIDLQVSEGSSFLTSSGVVHNCRIYGITPEEEFKPRFERLKVLYADHIDATFRDQCNLVSTSNGKKVTIKDTKDWWDRLVDIEHSAGIDKKDITEAPGGSYRTYPEQILSHVFSEKMLEMLQVLRVHGEPGNKQLAVKVFMKGARDNLKKLKE